jgi:hypothetical protein
MTMDFQNRALLNIDMPAYWLDVTTQTRNLGTLGGTVQVGDGSTASSFPRQIFSHGMYFDGSSDYLRRLEVSSELTFTDPLTFSFEMLAFRYPLQIGSYAAMLGHPGGGVGSSDPYTCFLFNAAGTMQIWFGSVSSGAATRGILYSNLGTCFPANMLTHVVGLYDGTTWRLFFNAVEAFTSVASGCYAPDAAAQGLLIGALANGPGAPGSFAQMSCYNFALYPFALLPSEIAQLYRLRLGLLNRGV